MPFIIPAGGARDGYRVARSLRFDGNAYLSRSATSGNRDVLTFHCWIKRGVLTTAGPYVFEAFQSIGNRSIIQFSQTTDDLVIATYVSSSVVLQRYSNAFFRDPSAWFALTVSFDTTSNTYRAWIGAEELTWNNVVDPAAGTDTWFNAPAVVHYVGGGGTGPIFNGYMAHVHYIEGLALDYTSFLVQDLTTGIWGPKQYTGAYGTNGFKLNFVDNSGATVGTLGKDTSGNGNNYTPNNFSVTAGAGNDSVTDTPTSYGDDTGVGGQVRGNYCTLNPLLSSGGGLVAMTLSDGNLTANRTTGNAFAEGTFTTPSGKWYFEATLAADPGSGNAKAGLCYNQTFIQNMYLSSGSVLKNGSNLGVIAAAYTTNDVIGVAWDVDAMSISFYKNGALQTTQTSIGVSMVRPLVAINNANGQWDMNFGQRPFVHAAPTDYKAVCTHNLAVPPIKRGDDYMAAGIRTGTGAAFSVSGKRFQPDLVWSKSRSVATDHALYDSLRGVQKQLESNTSDAETTEATGLTAFNADGFSGGALAQLNTNTATYVDWLWKKSATAGVDIVLYTGDGANRTIAHSLGVAPSMIILKNRTTAATGWPVYHSSASSPASAFWLLNSTAAAGSDTTYWNNAVPTASVFSLGTNTATNASGASFVAYLFAEVPGFASFGNYFGNGSANGNFIWTGFRPRWVMVKRTSSTRSWPITDSARKPVNPVSAWLLADQTNIEATTTAMDFTANGFKLRSTDFNWNATPDMYVFAAFAEHPFKYARAR